MTKKEYIDFVRNSLPQVDKTNKYHREQVAAALNTAINTVFYDLYEKNPAVMQKSFERYTTDISTVGLPSPSLNSTTGRYEMALGVDVVDLPRKTGGVLNVFQTTSTTTKLVPVSVLEGLQFYGAEATLPGNVIGYSLVDLQTIEFWGMTLTQASGEYVAKIIKQFREYASTDNVLLPYGQDQKIIELTREFLGLPPKDLVNNNADNG